MTTSLDSDLPIERRPRYRLAAWFIAILFFIALAPTLVWQEFSSGPENLVVATSMEMRRGGPWLIPTLQGDPRIAKPPLAAWITALSIHPETMREIDVLDRDTRERGFFFLSLEARWPALLSTCLLLLGVFELGSIIGGNGALGLASAAICASTYFLQRFARYSTTDIQLALWVTWGNVFLAMAIVRKRYWVGLIGTGITLGLAMMSKGPVALIQSILPMATYALLARPSRNSVVTPSPRPTSIIFPLMFGAAFFALVGFWWYALILSHNPAVAHIWFSEVTRVGATQTAANSPFAYCAIVGYVMPWSIFLIVGFVVVVRQLRQKEITRDALPFLLLILPLLVMSFAKDRQDRYTLPMIPAAAIIAAIGLRESLSRWKNPSKSDRIVITLHWIFLAAIAVALPLLGATGWFAGLRQADGQPWFSFQFAAIESSLGATLLLAGIFLYRRRRGALLTMSVVTMLVLQAAIFKGYCASPAGRSELKPFADLLLARYPDGQFFNAHPSGKRPPTDLGVYLNRTIRWMPNAATLRPTTHPAILFMLQNKGEPEPTPPANWEFVEKARRDKDWWWAFVLPPS